MTTHIEALAAAVRDLEADARSLDPDREQRQALVDKANAYAQDFLESLATRPMYVHDPEEGRGLAGSPFGEEPQGMDTLLELLDREVITPGLNPASPGHLGYIPGSGLFAGALGDFLAAVTNRYAGIYAASPGAARMETMVIKWFAEMAGYPDTAAGDLTSGGSIANLSAIVAARDRAGLKAREFHRAVVYLTAHTHHCVEKAVRTAGMGEAVIRLVDVDGAFAMDPEHLVAMIESDREQGLIPWLLVASAGTTDTGAVDPLESLADITREHGLWFHVDGAYGAAFVLCPEGRERLAGIERSDSLTMDPHKGLFAPFGTGLLLVRDPVALHRPYQYQANYLQDETRLATMDQVSPAELSPELSRHFRGLRVWLALKLVGVGAFRAALSEKMLLARYAWHRLSAMDGMAVGPYPDLSIVIFRFVPEQGNADAFNQDLVERIMADGRVYLSSTLINNTFMLRLAILSFRTHLEKLEQALTIIETLCRQIGEEGL